VKLAFSTSTLLLSWQTPCWAESGVTTPSRKQLPPPALELPLISAGVHLGLLSYGRGALQNECAGSCTGFAANSTSYGHGVAFGMGADAFVNIEDLVRVGPSLFYTFPNHVQIDGTTSDFAVGSDLAVDLAVEVAPRITRALRVLPRIQAGATILFPGSDLSRVVSALSADCPAGTPGCNGIDAPYVGYNLGAGLGALYRLYPRLGLRADILVQYYSVRLYEVDATLFGQPIHVSDTLDGGRLFFMLGAEY
jgi:hypothetical protein